MNIRLDSTGAVNSLEDVENKYVTYGKNMIASNAQKANVNNAASISACAEFGGILSDNGMNAYSDMTNSSSNDISNVLSKKDQEKNYKILMSQTVSDDELKRMSKDGFKIENMDPEEIVTCTDRIKAVMAESGVVIEGYNDNLDKNVLESVTGSTVRAEAISKGDIVSSAMETYDLPLTDENRKAIDSEAEKAVGVSELTEGAMKYILKNGIEPTFDNLYMANHSALANDNGSAGGYYNNGGYLSKKADLSSVENIMPEIEEVIEKAGFSSNDEMVKDAVWMIENGIELTEDTFADLQSLKALPLPVSYEQAANAAAAALKNTGYVENAVPGEYKTNEQKAIEKIGELDELIEVARKENPEADSEVKPVATTAVMDNQAFSELSYLRQLEETRLIMTVSNTSFLIRNGIDIDFNKLNELVNNLKEAENIQREALFGKGSIEENNNAADLFEFTNKLVDEIPSLPASTIGSFLDREITLESFYREGNVNKNQMEAAALKYEPLMTTVRTDLGDSIEKAFRNVDDLLKENDIDVTKANEKAVRILGYNELPITKENVDKVREADERLVRVIGKMSPSATLSLIREGINPINMNLDELEAKLDDNRQDTKDDIQKYTSFLVKLDESGEISPEERESYIGIYRALYQIEKRDGAALGALMEQGGEMTLGNLLTQVRNKNIGKIDINIDDSFGLLEKVVSAGPSITEQIASATTEEATKAAVTQARENINQAAASGDMERQLLENGELKDSIDNILGARSLIKDRGLVLRAARNLPDKAKAIASDVGAEEDDLLDTLDKLPEALTDEMSAKDAYENMASRMKEILDNSIYTIDDMMVLKDVGNAISALKVSSALAKNEHYEIPMQIGDETSSVSVHVIRDEKQMPEVSIYTETEKLGRISATFTMSGDGLEGMILSDRQVTLDELSDKKDAFISSLAESGVNIKSVYFMENKNTGLDSVMRKSSPRSEDADISSKDLYLTAKEFLKLMK